MYKDIRNEYKEQANAELAEQLTSEDVVIYLDGCEGRTSRALRGTQAKLILVERDPQTFKIHHRSRPWANPILGDIVDVMESHPEATAIYFDGMCTIQKLGLNRIREAVSRMPKLRIYWQTINTRNNYKRNNRKFSRQRSASYALGLLTGIMPTRMKRVSPVEMDPRWKKLKPFNYKTGMSLIKFKRR